VALPRPEFRASEHKDCAPDHRRLAGGWNPGGLAQAEALQKEVTPHILRHSHVVNAHMAGVPVPMIQKQVGHKRLSTTEIYTTVAPALVK